MPIAKMFMNDCQALRDSESKTKPSGTACEEEASVRAEIEEKTTNPHDEEREDPINFGNQNTCVKIKDSEIDDREGQRMAVNLLSGTEADSVLLEKEVSHSTRVKLLGEGRGNQP